MHSSTVKGQSERCMSGNVVLSSQLLPLLSLYNGIGSPTVPDMSFGLKLGEDLPNDK